MAQRRMFSLQIVDTDAFLEMPASTQNLYFHLGMRADDDGFIANAKKIMKVVGAQEDDLKILFSKRFIIGFESGVIVIKHWRIHNYIAKDRYNETAYLDEKSILSIKDNGSYTECIQDVDTGKVRLGKVSKVKENIECGSLKNVKLTQDDYDKLTNDYNKTLIDNYIERLSLYIPNKKPPAYKDHNAVIRSWLNKDNVKKIVDNSEKKDNYVIPDFVEHVDLDEAMNGKK